MRGEKGREGEDYGEPRCGRDYLRGEGFGASQDWDYWMWRDRVAPY
jgi:hypothetical protein